MYPQALQKFYAAVGSTSRSDLDAVVDKFMPKVKELISGLSKKFNKPEHNAAIEEIERSLSTGVFSPVLSNAPGVVDVSPATATASSYPASAISSDNSLARKLESLSVKEGKLSALSPSKVKSAAKPSLALVMESKKAEFTEGESFFSTCAYFFSSYFLIYFEILWDLRC